MSGGSDADVLLPEVLVNTDTYLKLFNSESEDAILRCRRQICHPQWFELLTGVGTTCVGSYSIHVVFSFRFFCLEKAEADIVHHRAHMKPSAPIEACTPVPARVAAQVTCRLTCANEMSYVLALNYAVLEELTEKITPSSMPLEPELAPCGWRWAPRRRPAWTGPFGNRELTIEVRREGGKPLEVTRAAHGADPHDQLPLWWFASFIT